MRTVPLRMVIFDCDGVLIDSETIASRVVAASLTEEGLPMTPDEAHRIFLGMSLIDMVPLIEKMLGRPVSPGWRPALASALLKALEMESVTVPGAKEVLEGMAALGLEWRVASNSSQAEMAVKFARTGLSYLTEGRTFSGGPGGSLKPKPAPDVFLAAAADAGIPAEACVVVEDSIPGSRGARAAGMEILGFAPYGDGEALKAEGVTVFRALSELPMLFRQRMQVGSTVTA
ncbi:Phosphatase/phosphohexomutase family protein [Granulibacter bethesdensis]|uniref:Phosphatase/phosphohexomutase family protein n=1 Tax=Granulibacter bethesdensis TaxID=364410 RepID=A0AAN0VGV5_9PROT|nr:HAD-IA family hydrolase [Granulibacter bethesdensis]AHJ64353.1 Phosphatase/phosphohexomutase family protein [Granulibacter bethesdensis]